MPFFKGVMPRRKRRKRTKRQVRIVYERSYQEREEMGVNKVIIVGNLGADPEMRFTAEGRAVTNFRVAASRRWRDTAGQILESTEWFYIVVWGGLAETCNRFLAKGRLVYVEGRLETRSWQAQDGTQHYRTEVVARNVQFLGKGASTLDSPDAEKLAEALAEAEVEVGFESVPSTKPTDVKQRSSKVKVIKK